MCPLFHGAGWGGEPPLFHVEYIPWGRASIPGTFIVPINVCTPYSMIELDEVGCAVHLQCCSVHNLLVGRGTIYSYFFMMKMIAALVFMTSWWAEVENSMSGPRRLMQDPPSMRIHPTTDTTSDLHLWKKSVSSKHFKSFVLS